MPEYQEIEWKESCRDEYLKGLSGYAIVRDGTLFNSKDDNGKVIVIIGGKKMLEALSNKIANAQS